MVTAKDVKETIEYYLKNFRDNNKYVEVAFFGGSFTAIDVNKQIELLEAVQEYISNKKVNSIRISTRPDCIDKEILKRMKKYHVKTIELGVQSTNNYILNRCKRGHTGEDVKKASKLIRMHGFVLGHQMMIGLPESTKQDEINIAKDFARKYNVILLLKGPTTVVTNGQEVYLVKRGCPGMATAGSGDVLSGILVGMLGYNEPDILTVAAGAYLNGMAGEIAQEKYTDISMVASDTAKCLPEAVKKIREA